MPATDADIVVDPISETKNYGSVWRVSNLTFDVKSGRVIVQFESHDGSNYTGKLFRAECNADGTTDYYSDGTSAQFATPKIDGAGVQGLIAWATLKSFAQARAR